VLGTGRFLAEYAPCFEVGDGAFDGGVDFIERGIELGLLVVSSPPGTRLTGTISMPSTVVPGQVENAETRWGVWDEFRSPHN
jgi:hypothetical protein